MHFTYFDMANAYGDHAYVSAVAVAAQIVLDRRSDDMRVGFVGGPSMLRGLSADVMSHRARRWPGTERMGGGVCVSSIPARALRHHFASFVRAFDTEAHAFDVDPFIFTPTTARHGVLHFSSVGHERMAWCHAPNVWSSTMHAIGFSVSRDEPDAPLNELLVA